MYTLFSTWVLYCFWFFYLLFRFSCCLGVAVGVVAFQIVAQKAESEISHVPRCFADPR